VRRVETDRAARGRPVATGEGNAAAELDAAVAHVDATTTDAGAAYGKLRRKPRRSRRG